MRRILAFLIAAGLTTAVAAAEQPQTQPQAQNPSWIKLDVPFVRTPTAVIEAMLALAQVGRDDVVYDLGSGDGPIVIAAVRDRGAKRGVGIELNPMRITEATRNAATAGVTDRVAFIEGDIFTADFSAATVVTMYLWDNVNLRLRPRLLAELAPGTRVVSHQFHMFDWTPDGQEMVNGKVPIYFWVIPAQVQGVWRGSWGDEPVTVRLKQSFQMITGSIETGGGSSAVRTGKLAGRSLALDAGSDALSLVLDATVSGDTATGTLSRDGRTAPISLQRAPAEQATP
jgi:Ribosomal protein L11 methyltransferase (PrmA)